MLRTAVIGWGAIVQSHLDDILFFGPQSPLRADTDEVVELVAACDIRPEALEQCRQRTGLNALYTDYVEMLERERPDYVHVCTCAHAHLGPVLAAAERGIHVLCEKPMGVDCAECDEMIAACERAQVQLVISHQRRCDPVHWYARSLVNDGFIGDLRLITGSPKDRRGGNEMHNIGSHLVDAIGIFAGPVDWVWGYCSTDGHPSTVADREPGDRGSGWVLGERVDVVLSYHSGVQAHLRFNPDPRDFYWELWGTRGRLRMQDSTLCHCPDPVARPQDTWTPVEPVAVPVATDSGYVNPPDWLNICRRLGPYPRVFMMREMFQRMRESGEHTSSGRVGAAPIEVMQAVFVSHLTNSRVSLPLEQRRSPLV